MEILPIKPPKAGGKSQVIQPPVNPPPIPQPIPSFEGNALLKDITKTQYGLAFNCQIFSENYIFAKNQEVKLQFIDNNNNVGITIVGEDVNWYSNDGNNYNGSQFIVTDTQLESLTPNTVYKASLSLDINDKTYTQSVLANGVTMPTNQWDIKQISDVNNFEIMYHKPQEVPTNVPVTKAPVNYEASNATSMQSYSGSIDFTFQGTADDKNITVVGGNLGTVYPCTKYGTNQFYCYINVPNSKEQYAIYYLISINNGTPCLDPSNTNIGIYKGEKCSYYVYEP